MSAGLRLTSRMTQDSTEYSRKMIKKQTA